MFLGGRQALVAADRPFADIRLSRPWVITLFPTAASADLEEMDFATYEDFIVGASTTDPRPLREAEERLAPIVNDGQTIRIVTEHPRDGRNLALELDISHSQACMSYGLRNFPDGEVFTSVVEDSVNGHIYFDVPAVYRGRLVQGVFLRFRDGQVVEHRAEVGQELLTQILNTDEGARRIGEFGIGLNYRITRPTKMILFDEKIGGTIHLAVGRGYPETLSKNKSAIHWDLIKDLRPDGRIYFDGELVMEKGRWLVLPESI